MISLDKKYQTRDGREVRIYALDGAGAFPVQGAIKQECGWEVGLWRNDGNFYADGHPDPWDLIEVKPERTGWLNLYADGAASISTGTLHGDKAGADSARGQRGCLACVQITFREGDGL